MLNSYSEIPRLSCLLLQPGFSVTVDQILISILLLSETLNWKFYPGETRSRREEIQRSWKLRGREKGEACFVERVTSDIQRKETPKD